MTPKTYKLKAEELLELVPKMGGCIASDKITVEGMKIGYMYREGPDFEHDSGWRFFAGTETQEYADNHENFCIYNVNTIANYDKVIIPYLEASVGTKLERIVNSDKFILVTE